MDNAGRELSKALSNYEPPFPPPETRREMRAILARHGATPAFLDQIEREIEG
jgi:hypothetical protein